MMVKDAVDKAVTSGRKICGLTEPPRIVSPFDQALFGQIVAVEAIANVLGVQASEVMQQYVEQVAETPAHTD